MRLARGLRCIGTLCTLVPMQNTPIQRLSPAQEVYLAKLYWQGTDVLLRARSRRTRLILQQAGLVEFSWREDHYMLSCSLTDAGRSRVQAGPYA